MSAVIQAVYEHGVLRLLQPLNLRERQRVRIQIWPEPASSEKDEILQLLAHAGLLRPRSGPKPPPPLSDRERRALANRIAHASPKPLSETVIEERGAW